jgi:transcriptional regulator with XRE-family HTH domain
MKLEIAERIKARLEASGLTARALSLNGGLNATAARDIFSGRSGVPRLRTVIGIAKALDCRVSDLITKEEIDQTLVDPSDYTPRQTRDLLALRSELEGYEATVKKFKENSANFEELKARYANLQDDSDTFLDRLEKKQGERVEALRRNRAERRPAAETGKPLDFSGANLTGTNLSGADLRSADFTGANLTEANLSNADLRHAIFKGATLTGTILVGANIKDADFSETNLGSAKLV